MKEVTRMERISVRVPETYRERAERLAKELDRDPSWVYRQAIRQYLAIHDKPEDAA